MDNARISSGVGSGVGSGGVGVEILRVVETQMTGHPPLVRTQKKRNSFHEGEFDGVL